MAWININQQLPEGTFYSPMIWLLLSDGRKVIGHILHKAKDATYEGLFHDWSAWMDFEGPLYSSGCAEWNGAELIAWQPIVPPVE